MNKPLFPGREEANPESVSRADIVVGIIDDGPPESLVEKRRQAGRTLREVFPDKSGAVILSEDRSEGPAREAFFRESMEVPGICLSTPPGVTGRGNRILNLLERARELGAESIAVISRRASDPTVDWVRRLLEPTFQEFSLVSPIYARHPGEGSLTSNVVYPLLRSLFGKRVREPMGGDYGLSGTLADLLLEDVPEGSVHGYGIDVWITTTAVARGVPLCQTFLGGASTSGHDTPVPEPPAVFSDTMETVFFLMQKYHDQWKSVRWSKPTVVFGVGVRSEPGGEPAVGGPAVLYAGFQEAFPRFESLWKEVLHRDVYEKLREVKKISLETFEFPALMWTLSLFAFALAYKRKPESVDALVECLLALYMGRTCSTAISTSHMSSQQAEVYLEDQCRVFEETKPYLEYLWEKR